MTDEVIEKNRKKYIGYRIDGTGLDATVIVVDMRVTTAGTSFKDARKALVNYHESMSEKYKGLARLHKERARASRRLLRKDIRKPNMKKGRGHDRSDGTDKGGDGSPV